MANEILKRTKSYLRFSTDKYPGVSENPDLTKVARRIDLISQQAAYIERTGSNPDDTLVKTYRMLQEQTREVSKLTDAAFSNIEAKAKEAKSKLFSNASKLAPGEAALSQLVLDEYRNGNNTTALISNPESAKHLAALAKLGFVPDSVMRSINKQHSPEAFSDLEQASQDAKTLDEFEREYQTFKSQTADEETAQRLIDLEPAAL